MEISVYFLTLSVPAEWRMQISHSLFICIFFSLSLLLSLSQCMLRRTLTRAQIRVIVSANQLTESMHESELAVCQAPFCLLLHETIQSACQIATCFTYKLTFFARGSFYNVLLVARQLAQCACQAGFFGTDPNNCQQCPANSICEVRIHVRVCVCVCVL